MQCFKRIREWVAIVQMGGNRTDHDKGESERCREQGSCEKQTRGTERLRHDDEVQKPNGVA